MYYIVQTDKKDRRFKYKLRAEKELEKRIKTNPNNAHALFFMQSNGFKNGFELIKRYNP